MGMKSIRQAQPLTTTWEKCQCEGVGIHGYSGTLLLYGWRCIYDFIPVMSMCLVTCHRRACEPPGNLDTTLSYIGGRLGNIWSGGLGQVSEN